MFGLLLLLLTAGSIEASKKMHLDMPAIIDDIAKITGMEEKLVHKTKAMANVVKHEMEDPVVRMILRSVSNYVDRIGSKLVDIAQKDDEKADIVDKLVSVNNKEPYQKQYQSDGTTENYNKRHSNYDRKTDIMYPTNDEVITEKDNIHKTNDNNKKGRYLNSDEENIEHEKIHQNNNDNKKKIYSTGYKMITENKEKYENNDKDERETYATGDETIKENANEYKNNYSYERETYSTDDEAIIENDDKYENIDKNKKEKYPPNDEVMTENDKKHENNDNNESEIYPNDDKNFDNKKDRYPTGDEVLTENENSHQNNDHDEKERYLSSDEVITEKKDTYELTYPPDDEMITDIVDKHVKKKRFNQIARTADNNPNDGDTVSTVTADVPLSPVKSLLKDFMQGLNAFRRISRYGQKDWINPDMEPSSLVDGTKDKYYMYPVKTRLLKKYIDNVNAGITRRFLDNTYGEKYWTYPDMGPGTFKTAIIKYPPNYHQTRVRALLKTKERNDRLKGHWSPG